MPATMKEKQQVLRDTMFSRAKADLDLENQGRHAKPTAVGGVEYPRLPSSSPWHQDPVPNEEAYGEDISQAPIVGEVSEVNASLTALASADAARGGELNLMGKFESPPNPHDELSAAPDLASTAAASAPAEGAAVGSRSPSTAAAPADKIQRRRRLR